MTTSRAAACRRRAAWICGAWLLCLSAACGQTRQPALSRDTLPEAEVTARRAMEGTETAAPLQRLGRDDLQRRGAADIGGAVRRLAGANLRDYGGAGGLKTVSVRGMGAAHTAVSYDGLTVTDAQQGQTDLQRFSLDALSRMELHTLDNAALLCPVRQLGPAVLSLYTAMPDTAARGWHGEAALRQASFGTYAASLNASRRSSARTAWNIAGDYFFAHNDYPFFVENGVASTHERRTNSRMQAYTAEANLAQATRGGGVVRAKAYWRHSYRLLPGQVRLYAYENEERLGVSDNMEQVSWRQRYGRWEVTAAAKYAWQESRYKDVDGQYPGGALRYNYWQRDAYATGGAAVDATGWLRLAAVTDIAYDTFTSNRAGYSGIRRGEWLTALSARVHCRWGELTLRGVAHFYANHTPPEVETARRVSRLTPAATFSVPVKIGRAVALRLRAGYKEHFRVPSFTEAYYYHLGTKDLKPELTRQLSGGVTLRAAARRWCEVALTVDGYASRVSDRITSIPVNLYVWRTTNMGRVKTTGLDATAQIDLRLAARHAVYLAGNYSLQRCVDRTSSVGRGSDTYGLQTAYTPLHSGTASAAYENPWLSLSASVSCASERWSTNEHLRHTRLRPYAEWGFSVYRTIALGGVSLRLRTDLVNAFDSRYEIIARYPMPGRAYRLSATLTW